MDNSQKILISGGAGFIGSSLALRLIELGHSVRVLDNLSAQIHGNDAEKFSPLYLLIKDKVEFIKGDVTNRSDWEKAIEGTDVIVHLAAETGTGQSMYRIEKYSHVNSDGTALMYDVLVNRPNAVKKVVLASSRAVYGEGKYEHPDLGIVYPKSRNPKDMEAGIFDLIGDDRKILKPLPTDEDSKISPASVYAVTKFNQEQLTETVCDSVGIDYVILRYQNVYGAGQSMKNPYTGILSVFSTQIISGKKINVFEDGLPSRDFVEVSDVVDATVRSVFSEKANRNIINVGTGKPTTVIDVAEALMNAFGKRTELEISGDFRIGDIRYNVADLNKMKLLLGFEPKIGFEDGIKKYADWAVRQELGENLYEQSLREMNEKGLFRRS
ncbi:MAG: NAD-dependent epimerase/dehydratase family protein [Moheibacter sp.]